MLNQIAAQIMKMQRSSRCRTGVFIGHLLGISDDGLDRPGTDAMVSPTDARRAQVVPLAMTLASTR
jgi:hypothetical protein